MATSKTLSPREPAMKTFARFAASAPADAVEDALGLAALCLIVATGFAATGLV